MLRTVEDLGGGGRIDVTLVAGGRYHDIDFARLQLLGLLAEHERVPGAGATRLRGRRRRSPAAASWSATPATSARPTTPQRRIRHWVEGGGRWVALHGTNAALDLGGPDGVVAHACFPLWADTLGSQFVAHPPIQPVPRRGHRPRRTGWSRASSRSRPTTSCTSASTPTATRSRSLLHTDWQGEATGFVEADWTSGASTPPGDVPAAAGRRRSALQHARPLPGPLRHGARARLLPARRTLLLGAARLPRAAPPLAAVGTRPRR